MPEECGDRLTGLYAEITLVCQLRAGHHGRHEDARLGVVIEWTDNAIKMLNGVAA